MQIFAVANNGNELTGASAPLPAGARGTHDVAPITVKSPVTISGRVLTMAGGLRAEPAIGATVQVGRAKATTGDGGTFKLTGVAAGAAKLTAAAANVATTNLDLTLEAGETRTLAQPLILFPQAGVYGVMTLMHLSAKSIDSAILTAGEVSSRKLRLIDFSIAMIVTVSVR